MTIKSKAVHFYDIHYKKLMIFSFLLLFFCVGSLVVSYISTGELFQKAVSLKGGITMTIPVNKQFSTTGLTEQLLMKYPRADITVREITENGAPKALIIEATDIEAKDLESILPQLGVELKKGEYSIENMGSSLGDQFFSQTIKALLMAFIAMAIVVFITFRSLVPSLFVILAAVSDIVSTLAVVNFLEIKVGTAGIAAFLMLIGYSVDTDILLTTKVLKRRGEGGTVFDRTMNALRTGILLTGTALTASIIGLIFTQSDTVKQIMLIITIGLVFDIIYTWFQNAGILRMYMEKKHGQN